MCVYIYTFTYILFLVNLHPTQPERGAGERMSVCDLCGWSSMCVLYRCTLCACAYCEYQPHCWLDLDR